MNELERAIDIALDAYSGQKDKAEETYIRHPLRVMQQMDTERERVVAVLHDVVEDSDYTLEDIEEAFDREVRDAVDALTKRKEEKEEEYSEFISRVEKNDLARKVKQADIRDNMDLNRLPELDDNILEKQVEYHEALQRLETVEAEQ